MRKTNTPQPRHPLHSARAATVAAWFGLTYSPTKRTQPPRAPPNIPLPRPGQIFLITGPSGAGKSSLLRALQSRARRPCINLATIPLPNRPLIDLLPNLPIDQALQALAKVGLAEAQSYLHSPAELSEGQRWRLRLALAIHQSTSCSKPGNSLLVSDEFAALLDRVTAAIVAHALRRAIDRSPNLSAVLATSHDDLTQPLAPDRIIHCDFGETAVTTQKRRKEAYR